MKRNIIFLAAIILLYLVSSLTLNLIYGDSYPIMAGEDFWEPDSQGSWVKHGEPSAPMPSEPSVVVPLIMYYLPVFIPGLFLFLFLFTPLKKLLESKVEADEEEAKDSETSAV